MQLMFAFLFPSVILNGAPQQCFLHSILQREVKDPENLSFAMQYQGISTGEGIVLSKQQRCNCKKSQALRMTGAWNSGRCMFQLNSRLWQFPAIGLRLDSYFNVIIQSQKKINKTLKRENL